MPASRSVETMSWGMTCMLGGDPTPRGDPGASKRIEPAVYFRWSQGPSGIHLARFVVNSSGHTVTREPFCHWSM